MSQLTQEQIRHVATLASLDLTDDELTQYSGDLSNILGLVEKLGELDLGAVSDADADAVVNPTIVADGIEGFRADVANRPLTHEALLKNAPEAEDGFFKVPKILES